MKKSLKGQEEVSNEVVGAARVEAAGMSLFEYADKEDRRGSYHKSVMMLIIAEINIIFLFFRNMVKAYFTSFHMFGIVKGMEELNEEV